MSDHDFEQRLARRLHDYSAGGLRPFDALEIGRAAMAGGSPRATEHGRPGPSMPLWLRALVFAGLLIGLLIATAVVGGLIQLPTPIVPPTPTATVPGEQTPSPSAQPTTTGQPSPTPSAGASPTASPPTAAPPPTSTPTPSPTSTPSPTPTVTPSPSPTAVVGWRAVADFPAAPTVSLSAATYGNAGFVFVTVASGEGNSWVSADGMNWTRSTDGDFDGAAHIVARGGEYVAIGTVADGQGRRVWRSTDGLNWTLLTASPVLEFVNDLTVDDGLLIAVGTSDDFDAPRVWTSPDGVTWTAIAAPAASSELTRVAARNGDIVVLGDDFNGYGRVIWSRAAQSGEWVRFDAFGDDDGRLVDLATDGRLFVAVGYQDDFVSGVRAPAIHSSADGASWTTSILVGDSGVDVFEQLVVLPDGRLLAVGSRRTYSGSGSQLTMDEVGYAFVAEDGTAWAAGQRIWTRTEQVPPEVGDQVERYRPVAAGGPGAVVGDEWQSGPQVFFAPLGELR